MWPFSSKWRAPSPRLAMVVALTKPELPPLVMLANPDGFDGAVKGMAGPADQQPTADNMMRPMKEGAYVAISPAKGCCSLRVERIEPGATGGLELDPDMLAASGLSEEMLAKFNQPAWRVMLQMESPAKEVSETVLFATRLAQRLALLGDGVVMDTCAYRFFGPEGWAVEEPVGELDAREHVHVHIETGDGNGARWFHTHGMLKFGRPEMEIYEVAPELDDTAFALLLNTAQYVISTALIEPGQTCGDPNQPFYARAGTKSRDGHWEDASVLELVDVDERRQPVATGAPKALQAFAVFEESQP